MIQGTVKFFNSLKGWGFITPDDGGEEVFVHYKSVQGDGFKSLLEGSKVEFNVESTDRGPQAKDVRVVLENLGNS